MGDGMSSQVETQTYTGTLVELGGAEMGSTGNEKPRAVRIKADPSSKYPKTFRTWHDSLEWNDLEEIGLGSVVTVEYIAEERQGGPQGSYTVNTLVGVRQDGAGASAPDGGGGDWGEPQEPRGEVGSNAGEPVAPQPSQTIDPVTRSIISSWAIEQAIREGARGDEAIHTRAHEIVVLKDRIASELG